MAGDREQHDVVAFGRTLLLVGIAGAVHEFSAGQHLEIGFVGPLAAGDVGELESGDLQRFVFEPVGNLTAGLAGDLESNKCRMRAKKWLPDLDSNQDKLNQNQLCYRYTIGQNAC